MASEDVNIGAKFVSDPVATVVDNDRVPVGKADGTDGVATWFTVRSYLETALGLDAANITTGAFADARVAESNITQHEAAINHDNLTGFVAAEHLDWSQDQGATNLHANNIPDLSGTYLTGITGEPIGDLSDVTVSAPADDEVLAFDSGSGLWINQTAAEAGLAVAGHTHDAAGVVSGTFADARIAASNVTQHQAALSITESQISDLQAYLLPADIAAGTITAAPAALDLSGGSDGHVLTKQADGSLALEAVPGGANAIDDLTDVTITTPADNEVLAFDTGTSEWINQTPAEAGLAAASHSHTLSDVTDSGAAAAKGVTGLDADAVTGTAGTDGDLAQWNADGDLVDGPTPPSGDIVGTTDTQTLSGKSIDAGQLTGSIADARVPESAVTQHEGALSIAGSQITALPVDEGFALSDETTDLTTGTKLTVRLPYAMTLTGVFASVTTAPTGSTIIVDIQEGGVSVFSTKLTIDAGEESSDTAATPAVISDSAIAQYAEITFIIDQIGSSTAGAGLKVWLTGTRA